MISSACDRNEVGIRRSVVALTVFVVTPSGHGAIDSESDAVISSACDGDEVGIRWSVVALNRSTTPSDDCAAGDTSSRQAAKRGGVVLVECS